MIACDAVDYKQVWQRVYNCVCNYVGSHEMCQQPAHTRKVAVVSIKISLVS